MSSPFSLVLISDLEVLFSFIDIELYVIFDIKTTIKNSCFVN